VNEVQRAIDYFFKQMYLGKIEDDEQQEVYEIAIKYLTKHLGEK
jgi:hypothetical protein